ncbi:MAG: hypothetical protein HY067_14265 [Betaproteobacteria bacterium]|nr:hypothetical protein [Betaproteobacteria bacterium]
MNFVPYHAFRDCEVLEETIQNLRANGAIPGNVCASYDTYHFSLLHKLRSAKYHADTLREYLETQATATHQVSPFDLIYRVNFHFDGFGYCIGSALDIFSREILTYFGIPLPQLVYFDTAENQLLAQRAGDPVIALIQSPAWRQEFSDYRNTATHESVVGTEYQIAVSVVGSTEKKRLVFPLPDDPRVLPRTYRRNPDIVEYCRLTMFRVLSIFNQTYAHVNGRIQNAGTLPI